MEEPVAAQWWTLFFPSMLWHIEVDKSQDIGQKLLKETLRNRQGQGTGMAKDPGMQLIGTRQNNEI